MKANELMVGDYLMHNGFPYRVIQVDGIVRDGWMIENGEEDCGEPIPITPEILEKNFESESNIFGLQTYKLNENFNLENRGDRFCLVRKCRDYYSSTFWICDLIHLHQLQHALRLCGINKIIEL